MEIVSIPKPYSEAADQNKAPILAVLREAFTTPGLILEVGSGTGQHAVHFARHLPWLCWQTSDRAEYLPAIRAWLAEAELPNLPDPMELDVTQQPWPLERADGAFTANTTHIMDWPAVEALFLGVGRILTEGGRFCLYGPVNYNGQYTSPSNAQFDRLLRGRDPASGLRDFADLDALARRVGLSLERDHPMPVNNRTLVWRKPPAGGEGR